MTTDWHRRAKEIFVSASELPTAARAAFVDEQCGLDRTLREEVMSLLGFHDSAGTSSAPAWARAPWDGADSVGAYRLLEKLGEGGMGVVYEAEQTHPVRRRVAVKLIKWGMDTREVLARFESERQALALMDHPAIARVYEAGATEQGRPFFAMELARGAPLTEYCDARELPIPDRLRIFLQVCMGVQHAHQKGVIHRDLKPSNLIVTEPDARPVAKIIDFGIARATAQRDAEETVFTRLGQWVGTPECMSPEQAEPGHLDVDTRTDVYSLGVVLYELLAGVLPFDAAVLRGAGFAEMRRQIREVDAPRPSSRVGAQGEEAAPAASRRRLDRHGLTRALRGDLDWIVMKAMEKDRSRRYGSAAELAADLERHLACEPVLAGPPSTSYRLGKLLRRHRLAFGAAALVVLALLLGIVGTTTGLRRAEREAQAARRATDVLAGVFLVLDPTGPTGQAGSMHTILDRGAEIVDRELADQPALQARVLSALGQTQYGLGHYDHARTLLDRALGLQRRYPPRQVDEMLRNYNLLGWVHAWSGEYPQARGALEEGLKMAEASSSAGLRIRIALHVNLIWLAWRTGDLDEAQRQIALATALSEGVLSPEDSVIADLLYFRSLILREQRKPELARQLLVRCLAIRERVFGREHLSVAWTMLDLGFAYMGQGQREQARASFERCLELEEKLLGPNHAWVAYPLTQLGALDLQAGDLAAARRRLDRALALREQALGHDHPDLVWTLLPLAELHRRTGEHEISGRLLQRARRIVEAALPAGHPDHRRVLVRLERNARETGRLEEARALARRLAELVGQPGAERHPAHARDVYNLACITAQHGERSRALELLAAALAEGFVDAAILDDPDLVPLAGPELEALRGEVRRRLAAPDPPATP